ncbi:hypothetical protein BVY01_02985 [bacterium I07]|nr:hypothetical protein BVY01_02985 [bacterium I07]
MLMSKSRKYLLGFLILIFAGCGQYGSEDRTLKMSEQEQEKIVQDVKNLWKELFKALNSGDYEKAFSVWDNPSGIYNASPMETIWEDQIKRETEYLSKLKRANFTLHKMDVKPLSKDIALSVGQQSFMGELQDGTIRKMRSTWTVILVKKGSEWKGIHFHEAIEEEGSSKKNPGF